MQRKLVKGGIDMDKEEILKRSRKENQNKDEMELAVFSKAGLRACGVGGIVCMAIILLESIFVDRINVSIWAVYLSMAGTMQLVKYQGFKKKYQLISAVLLLALALVFFVIYLVDLVG